MTSRDFCFWLQGHFELAALDNPPVSAEVHASRMALIEKHLQLVFIHEIDPSMGDAAHQQKLDAVHGGMSVQEALEEINKPRKPMVPINRQRALVKC